MKNKLFFKIIELAWVVMGVFCTVMGFYYLSKTDSGTYAWLIFLLALISFGMFFVRRLQRKNFEKRNKKYGNK